MASENSTDRADSDPFQLWREWLTQSERQLNRVLNEAMSSEAFGQSSGRVMEAILAFQRTMSHATELYFTALNIPTRNDILALGERLSSLEERLLAIESLLRTLQSEATGGAAARDQRKRPPRTRKPPQAET